jgi:hypothetical protein
MSQCSFDSGSAAHVARIAFTLMQAQQGVLNSPPDRKTAGYAGANSKRRAGAKPARVNMNMNTAWSTTEWLFQACFGLVWINHRQSKSCRIRVFLQHF